MFCRRFLIPLCKGKLFCERLEARSIAFFFLIRPIGRVWVMLSRLGIGDERNAPDTNLRPELCTVIIFKIEGFTLMKRKDPYSNFDSMMDLYIILSEDEFSPQEMWVNILRMFILVIVAFLSSFRWAHQFFLVSNF